ncbi:LysR family transcriptional regulator [Chloroflexia bacterium SDU3-3]|nr:LysR family transcriptional regulator [Chloroflexia bacterium SDU3-3]
MIDLTWYQSFIAIYRTGSVSRAAKARFLTQPAVSQHLAALEHAVGQPLFQRLPRRMLPTEYAKELYTQVAPALDALDITSQQLRLAADERPLVRVGGPPEYIGQVAMAKLLPLPLRLAVQFGMPQALIPLLEQGELDLVISSQRVPAMQVDYTLFAEEEFILIAASGHVPPEGDVEQLQRWMSVQPWLSYAADLPIIRRFWRQHFQVRPPFRPAVIIPDLRILVEAVALGHGLSVLPAYLCRQALAEGRIHELWRAPQPATNELWLATRRIDRDRPDLRQIADALRERV